MKKILFMFFCLFITYNVNALNTLAPHAKSAIIIEQFTGNVIYEYEADKRLAPASMTKMMSLVLIMEAIDNNVIKLNDKVTISSNASSMGGSQILLETGEQMTVDDLLKGITVSSGNDAVVALAERIGGTEENFVKMMNDKAIKLGLKNTNFKNCHGLDDKDHYSSSRDMAIIARELVKHKKILEYSSIYETYLRKGTDKQIWLVNTNKLVRLKKGVDGLKTGYTENSGYCLTATMKQNGMRVIAVVMGEEDSTTRNDEVSGMLDYAFAQYKLNTIITKNKILKDINIDKGKKEYVGIIPMEDVSLLVKKIDKEKDIKYDIKINDIKLPIKVGDSIGNLSIYVDNELYKKIGITVNEDVKKVDIITLYRRYIKKVITGNI